MLPLASRRCRVRNPVNGAVAALDARSHVRYRSTRGKDISCLVHPRPLSWRVRGEECLIAGDGATAAAYSLCAIEPVAD